jgi:3-hydroxybutyryl-CoA dehydrogenase
MSQLDPAPPRPAAERLTAACAIGVVGAGAMGAGIAQLAAMAGHPVQLFDAQPGAAERALARIATDLDGAVSRGKLDAQGRRAALSRLQAAPALEALASCALVIEAIVEQLAAKQGLFLALEAVLAPDAVLATNTSSLSITAVAQPLAHPERLIGWHFFNPATRMTLVEVIPGLRTDPALMGALRALSGAWGKATVDAPNAPGFIVNRVARPYYAEALRLAAEGLASLATLDRLMREAGGFPLGPFELMDFIGNDVNLSVTESVFQATGYDTRYAPHLLQQERVRAGLLGRKTGQGFHDYRAGAAKPVTPAVLPQAGAHTLHHARDTGALAPLLARLAEAGVPLREDGDLPTGTLSLGAAWVALSDGRTATERAAFEGRPSLLLDLALNYAQTPVIGACASLGDEALLTGLAAVLAPAHIEVLALRDVAGLAVMRTVACLANEAADLMSWTGTRAADIDTAMRLGTAYPKGPVAWANAIGVAQVVAVLTHLQQHYGDTRYRRAPLLSRAAHAGVALTD